jgi:hypothetical protein
MKIQRLRRSVTCGVACPRHREIDLQEDREIPACTQFGAVQENPVDDQRCRRRRLLRLRRDELVDAVIKMFRDIIARPCRAKRVEQQPVQRGVVVGIEEEAIGRMPAARVSDRARMVKIVDAGADDRAADCDDQRRHCISQHSLAGAIDAVDRDADAPGRMQIGNGTGETIEQRFVSLAHAAALRACWATRDPAACGCRGRF